MPFLAIFLITLALAGLNYLLMPRASTKGASADQAEAPSAGEGNAVPNVYGTVLLKNANCVWYACDSSKPDKENGQVIGHYYFMRAMLALCRGAVDKFIGLRTDDGQKWVGMSKWADAIANPVEFTSFLTEKPSEEFIVAHSGERFVVANGAWIDGIDEGEGDVEWNSGGFGPGTILYVDSAFQRGPFLRVDMAPASDIRLVQVGTGTVFYWTGAEWKEQTGTPAVETYWINDPLFFGQGIEGHSNGLQGSMTFHAGVAQQAIDPILSHYWPKPGALKAPPSYDGLCYVVFGNGNDVDGRMEPNPAFYYGNSARFPSFQVGLQRFPNGLGLTLGRHKIGPTGYEAANPACVLWEWLVDEAGEDVGTLDIDSFRGVGYALAAEGFGVSLTMSDRKTFEDWKDELLKVIDGVLYQDPQTGITKLSLVRNDYETADLPEFTDEDYLDDPDFSRLSWPETMNEVKVHFTDLTDYKFSDAVVQVHDCANYQVQGELNSLEVSYPWVTSREIAQRLAMRDLTHASYPLAKVKLVLNRKAWNLRKGSVFLLTDPQLGIVRMPLRVGEIDYGTVTDPKITIDALEDIFGLPTTDYIPPSNGWEDTSNEPPVPPADQMLLEVPYPLLTTAGGPAVREVAAFAIRGNAASIEDKITSIVGSTIKETTLPGFTPGAILRDDYAVGAYRDAVGFVITGGVDLEDQSWAALMSGGSLLLIDDEIMAFGGISKGEGNTWIVAPLVRAVLDTVPRKHKAGSRVWFITGGVGIQSTTDQLASDTFITERFQSVGAKGILPVSSAPVEHITTQSRQQRPYPPGDIEVSDVDAYSFQAAAFAGSVPVTWVGRNRLTQPAIVPQDAAEITPEEGTMFDAEIFHGWCGYDEFPLLQVDGTPMPMLTPLVVGHVGSLPPVCAIVGSGAYLGAVGVRTFDGCEVAPIQDGALYVGVGPTYSELIVYQETEPHDPVMNVWMLEFTTDAGIVTMAAQKVYGSHFTSQLTDARSLEIGTAIDQRAGDMYDNDGQVPFYAEVRSVRGDFLSLQTQLTGAVFVGGFGRNFGNLFGL